MKSHQAVAETGGSVRPDVATLPELGVDFETIFQETGWFIMGVRHLATCQPERRRELLAVCQDSILLLLFRANFSRESQVLYFSAFYKAACRIQQFLDEEGELFVDGDDFLSSGVFL